jgi:2-amino-4-hydroxy-6-hydroxymethyldihydropteridine diphosphokinase
MKYILSLGSNISNRDDNLSRSIELMADSGITIIKASSVYESEPVGKKTQSWYLNQIVEIDCEVDPLSLLHVLKKIEKNMGREEKGTNAPREIDIDIILAEGTILNSEELIIPHPKFHTRNFVLLPLKEISPDNIHPLFNKTIEKLWKESKDRTSVKLWRSHAQKE